MGQGMYKGRKTCDIEIKDIQKCLKEKMGNNNEEGGEGEGERKGRKV